MTVTMTMKNKIQIRSFSLSQFLWWEVKSERIKKIHFAEILKRKKNKFGQKTGKNIPETTDSWNSSNNEDKRHNHWYKYGDKIIISNQLLSVHCRHYLSLNQFRAYSLKNGFIYEVISDTSDVFLIHNSFGKGLEVCFEGFCKVTRTRPHIFTKR